MLRHVLGGSQIRLMNNLISFYLNEGCDSEGRTLAEIWAMSDDELMHTHDVVQWLFPLTEPSNFNPTAPVLSERQIALFHTDPRLRSNLLKSFRRFTRVFGLDYVDGCLQQVAHQRNLDAPESQLASVHENSQIADDSRLER